MKKMHLPSRMLSLLLAFALLLGFAAPARAADESTGVSFQRVDNSMVSGSLLCEAEESEPNASEYGDTDMVRVSIFLNKKSTLGMGYSTMDIAQNASVMSYQDSLKTAQQKLTASIERTIGEKLDVRWNLTLAANAISANVEYGQIAEIEKVPGVEKVVLETRYEPQETVSGTPAEPNMTVSTQMTGTNVAWQSGYTGAGTRIAIIDTGLDIQHQSVDSGAFHYALEENARKANTTYADYAASLNLLDSKQIAAVLDKLHVTERGSFTADQLYINEKLPFGFCYVDDDLDVTHEDDTMGEHGSHVAGIAAANRYIPKDGKFVSAAEAVGVVGNAPDAQILVMKVFGGLGGAYDSDYMVAIEDAILLGCDSVNLSLGSANPGMSIYSGSYGDILESMTKSDTVVAISMGNSGAWAESARNATGLPYVDHVSFHTGGSPGSYAAPLTVASVDNDGAVGHVFQIGGRMFSYIETSYYCDELLSLDTSEDKTGTEYDYVLLDAPGAASDYQGIDVTGKIVFVSRGEITFADKANEAHYHGAKALVVYNNEPGSLHMDLSDYYYREPAVSITQEEGQWIKEHSASVQTEAGRTYYTGKFFLDQTVVTTYTGSEYLTMSSFTSWGVPGDLSLKPDITAPGGSIYSINGTHSNGYNLLGGTDQYELMSGTSMSAPQMTGISALVLQSIQDRGISQTGLTDRALAQSLMMSTATPLKDANGNAYSLLQQGAGMVNTAAATSAGSYILVDGQSDGKVKAELGDDPDKTGVYSFSFTLHNLEQEERRFALSAELFTQAVVEGYANHKQSEEEMALFQSTSTTPLMALATWTVDGQLVNSAGDADNWDFNGDGKTDADDAQALLDFVTGARQTIENDSYADLNGDGEVSTYDVHLFLKRLGRDSVTLPAHGSVEISVTLRLTDAQKQELDALYTGGAFIQGMIHVEALGDAEGILGTSHSIPMLAYYGNWTDNSMYDVGNYQEFRSGEENRTPYLGNERSNTFLVVYGHESDTTYYFGGNPMVADKTYMPERNAVNSERGDRISQVSLSTIRNAAASRFLVMQNGQTVYEAPLGGVGCAYYHVNAGSWQSTVTNVGINWAPTEFAEGDCLELGLDLAPELYVHDGAVDWEALGQGAKLRVPVCIDDTDPVLEGVYLDLVNNTLVVSASDNQYVASAVLYNHAGTVVLAYTGAVQDAAPGETHDYVLSLDGVNGKKFFLQVTDYAMNTVTYQIELQIGAELPLPEMMIFALDQGAWVIDDFLSTGSDYDPSVARVIAEVPHSIVAASIVNHLVYASTDQAQLFVAPEDDLVEMEYVSQLPAVVVDMAYNPTTGKLYGVTVDNDLIEIDPILGETTAIGCVGVPTNTLAVDPDGNFYCSLIDTGNVFTFTLDSYSSPTFLHHTNLSNKPANGEITQSMEWNPNNGKLYWYGSYEFTYMTYPAGYGYLFEIDTEACDSVRIDQARTRIGALIITEQSQSGNIVPTDQVTDVQVSRNAVTIHRGLRLDLDASVRPWFTTDRTVTWSSSDEQVAVVDENGMVTAVDTGTCHILATSNLDPSKVGTCTVTVDTVDLKLEGVLKDTDGTTKLFSWDLAESKTWKTEFKLDTAINSVTYDGKNTLFLNDAVSDAGKIYEIDKTTGEIRNTYENSAEVPLWDMLYSKDSSTAEEPKIGAIWDWIFMTPVDPSVLGINFFNLRDATAPLFGVTTLGYEEIRDAYDEQQLAEHFVMIDGDKDIIEMWCYESEGTLRAIARYTPSDLDITFKIYETENKRSSLVCDEAGNLYLSFFNGTSNDIYSLTYDAEKNIYQSELLTCMGDGIWPAALYRVETGAVGRNGDTVTPQSEGAVTLTAETASLEELVASMEAGETAAPTGSLNSLGAASLPVTVQGAKTDIDCEGKTATVTITADEATTNGLTTLTYDPSQLTLIQTKGKAQYNSFSSADGKLTFGYAYETDAPAGAELATLTFQVKSRGEVTVTTEEDGEKRPGTVKKFTLSDCPSQAFRDLDISCWYHEYTDYVLSAGLMKGMGNGLFAPNGTLTRGMLVTTLYRLADEPQVAEQSTFTDVAEDRYYSDAVAWAQANGIAKGMTDAAFCPEAPVTREQAATFLYRYVTEYLKVEPTQGADLSVYKDSDKISGFAKDAVAWATAEGLFEGFPDNTMQPRGTLTRAQMAKLLMVLDQKF